MIQLPDFLLSLHKCLGKIIWHGKIRTIDKNTTTGNISGPKDVMDKNYTIREEVVLLKDRFHKMEDHMLDVFRKLEEVTTIVQTVKK